MPRFIAGLFSFGFIAFTIALIAFAWLLLTPNQLREPLTIVIARGSSVQEIGKQLTEAKLAPHPYVVRAAAHIIANNHLQAGEYAIQPRQSLVDLITELREGRAIVRRLMVVEGLTTEQIAAELQDNPALTGDLVNLPPEGSLLPNTYHYSFGDARSDLLNRMRQAAAALEKELWDKRDPTITLKNWQEVLVMASLIERETGQKTEERARVAGVFYNRLRLGMRLQSDPTVIYAIAGSKGHLGRSLARDDLTFPSPYNTYYSDGLPPGPICNPGRAAIEAALHPEHHDYLYFVADGSGGHAFAKDLETHNRNVASWYKIRQP